MKITRRGLFALIPGAALARYVPLARPYSPILLRGTKIGDAISARIPLRAGKVRPTMRIGIAPLHLVQPHPHLRYSEQFPLVGDIVSIAGWPLEYYVVTRVNQKSVELYA